MDIGAIEIISALTLLFGSLFGAFIVSAVRATQRNNAQPVRTIRVPIITKNEVFGAPNRGRVVTFQAEDGEIVKLAVTDDEAYSRTTEGMQGKLMFRSGDYFSFHPS